MPQDAIARIMAEVEVYLADPSAGPRGAERAHELLAELAQCVEWLEEERQDLGQRLTQHLEPARVRRAATFMS